MKRLVICALALGGFAASAQAADLSVGGFKDPLPEKISFAGVTIYGKIDVGYAYQEHGREFSPSMYTGLGYDYLGNRGSVSTLTNNAMSQSFVGVKVEEGLGRGFAAIGKAEVGFNPAGGEISDACKSIKLAAENGDLTHRGDGSRCGQLLNGQAYGGISHSTYGTLTIGRHNSFTNEGVGKYDPNHGSYAFSLIGFSGTAVAGTGATETARWDNSIKYVYQFGPVHAGVMYSNGGDSTSILGDAVGANVGFTYKGLSVDGYYNKVNEAVTLSGYDTTASHFLFDVVDNEAYAIMAKYVMELGGGFKDEAAAKVTVSGGYVHIDTTSPGSQNAYNGMHTLNGYLLGGGTAAGASHGGRTLQTGWFGASYETGPWALSGTWYHQDQNAFGTHASKELDWVSGIVDYKFNKHFDIYSGVTWVGDSTTNPDNVTVASGLRLKF